MSDGIRDSMNGSNAYLFGSHGRLPDAAPEPTGGQAQKARLEQIAERLAKCSSETEDAARGTVEDGADCNALWTAADHIDEARKSWSGSLTQCSECSIRLTTSRREIPPHPSPQSQRKSKFRSSSMSWDKPRKINSKHHRRGG
jgi:hypothetical protein